MTRKATFGSSMRETHFSFAPSFIPVNHGSYGATPRVVEEKHFSMQRSVTERPDVFMTYNLPKYLDESRKAVAPLLGVDKDEVVFVANATTGVNTVLRNLKFEEKDVIVYFSTIYDACEKTISAIGELSPLRPAPVPLTYPVEDDDIVRKLKEKVLQERKEGRNVKIAMFDTVLTFPGARMPWEDLVAACKELGVLSLIDGAHGIGQIDLTHLGKVNPDFFVSNCHKWLYVPRGCAVFHVPKRNQHLIRTAIPTSHAYLYPGQEPDPKGKPQFVNLFDFVATIDYTPYTCVPAAIAFREDIGGEEAIRTYCWDVARQGGERVAEILGTHAMDNKTKTMTQCCFSTVRLPLDFKPEGEALTEKSFSVKDAEKIAKWMKLTALNDFDTYFQIGFHAGSMWIRLSGQIYLGFKDFEWVGFKLKELCRRVNENPELIV